MASPKIGPNDPLEPDEQKNEGTGSGTAVKPAMGFAKIGPDGPHITEEPMAEDDIGPDGPH